MSGKSLGSVSAHASTQAETSVSWRRLSSPQSNPLRWEKHCHTACASDLFVGVSPYKLIEILGNPYLR